MNIPKLFILLLYLIISYRSSSIIAEPSAQCGAFSRWGLTQLYIISCVASWKCHEEAYMKMGWKTVLCLTIVVALAASVQINIENDLITNELDLREQENEHSNNPNPDNINPNNPDPDITEPGNTDPDNIGTEEGEPTTASTTVDDETTVNVISTTGIASTHTTTLSDANDATKDTEADGDNGTTQVTDSYGSSTRLADDNNGGANEEEFIVQTTLGPVQGFEWGSDDDIIAYIDIQYGNFSGYFQDSTHPEKWEEVHDVKEHNKRCPQLQDDEYVGDMDCLTLSIFTPRKADKAAVLFHIHESNFVSGSGDPSVYGPEHFVKKNVILVLPNYRLGPLGFLCLRNATAPGNGALKDLTLALKWLKENIESFGGDPSNIVVSADGTSGALAGYLALSSKSRPYISKVITESGAVLSHWALDRSPAVTAQNLIENIRALTVHTITFEETDVKTIIRAAKNITVKPCLEHNDHPFLSETPWTLLQRENISITFMIGSASHAGVKEALSVPDGSIEDLNENFGIFLPNDLRFESAEEKTTIGKKIRTQYFGENTIKSEHIEEMSLCYTDSWYLGPAIRTARALVYAGATVYFYEFSFVGELNRELVSMDKPVNGAARGDIIGYLFTQGEEQPKENSKEERMVKTMLDLWVTFIEKGQPKTDDFEWNDLRVTNDTQEQWLSIGTDIDMKRGLHIGRLQLWTEIYNEHFIEHSSFALQPLPNTYTIINAILFWFVFWKIHFGEYVVK